MSARYILTHSRQGHSTYLEGWRICIDHEGKEYEHCSLVHCTAIGAKVVVHASNDDRDDGVAYHTRHGGSIIVAKSLDTSPNAKCYLSADRDVIGESTVPAIRQILLQG